MNPRTRCPRLMYALDAWNDANARARRAYWHEHHCPRCGAVTWRGWNGIGVKCPPCRLERKARR